MKKTLLPALLCALALLASCGGEEPLNWTPAPAPTPVSTASASPATEEPWAVLTVDDLPAAPAEPEELFLDSSPQVFLLGSLSQADLSLYGLSAGYGGGVLLRCGEVLTHFDQVFASPDAPALPELYLTDADGDGREDLAVRYLMEATGDRVAYDLHVYRRVGEDGWSDLAVTHGACAQQALEAVETSYDSNGGQFLLSYGNTSAVYQVPEGLRKTPGRLTLDTCFFREQDGAFTVILGARLDTAGVLFANVLATVECQADGFTLRDIRVEPTTVV